MAVIGSQLTYCVEVAAELLADVEEQTVRSVHQAQRPGRESPKEKKRLAISRSNAVQKFIHQLSARCIFLVPETRRSHVRINSQQVEFPSQPVAPAQEHADFGSPTGDRDLRVRLSQESVHPWRVGDMPASNPAWALCHTTHADSAPDATCARP